MGAFHLILDFSDQTHTHKNPHEDILLSTMIPVSRSCPPGPWLPSSTGASGSRECHQLMSAPGVTAAGQTGGAGGTMSSSFSVTQRLNNQLSVDSGGSGGGHHGHHQHRQPLGSGLCDPPVMSRHPPHYSEATTAGATGQQLPHFPVHNNHS